MIEFILAHQVAMAAIVVAVIDFVIEINPALKSNTIISALLSIFKSEQPKV